MHYLSIFLQILSLVVISVLFFFLLSGVVYFLTRLWDKEVKSKEVLKLLGIGTLVMLGVQVIGSAIWQFIVNGMLVNEIDPWIPFLTFRTLTWERIFDGVDTVFHQPLGYFFTTAQVDLLYNGLALLLISLGGLIIFGLYRKRLRNNGLLFVASLFFVLQVIWLGLYSLVFVFL